MSSDFVRIMCVKTHIMRTKSLLIAAAALTAGLLSAQAQNVYSINIVGYVNTTLKGGKFNLIANPLDDGKGNQLTNLFPTMAKGSSIQIWNGSGFNGATRSASAWSTNFAIPPGTAVFVQPNSGDITNTFVGSVVPSPATNALPFGQFVMIGSKLPIGGTLNNDTNFGLGNTLSKGSSVQYWDTSAPGIGAFVGSTKGSSTFPSNIALSVGQGFFVQANNAGGTNWVQTLPAP